MPYSRSCLGLSLAALIASCSPTSVAPLQPLSDAGASDLGPGTDAPADGDANPADDAPVAPADVATSCTSDRDCSGMGMVCNLDQGVCVGCNTQNDCAAPLVCLRNACRSVTRCTSSVMCPQQVCSTRLGFCVDCDADVDCPAAEQCTAGVCVRRPPSCTSDRECSGMGLVCNAALAHCVACNQDADCVTGRYCNAGHDCVRQACTPGQTSCQDVMRQRTCDARGSAIAVTMCPAGQTCREGRCQMPVCVPGAASCDPMTGGRRVCNPDGGGYAVAPCAAGQSCRDGTCVAWTCAPGTATCASASMRSVCNADGLGATSTACPAGSTCSGTTCTTWVCTPGTAACASSAARSVCNADGLTTTATPCPTPANANAPTCTGGACGFGCNAGFGDCNGMGADGCETALTSTATHCGACGRACEPRANATASCAAGACAYACATGFGDCDGNAANGCETALDASLTNCGGCGVVCSAANATAACVRGACAVGTCAAGFANCNALPADGCEVAGSCALPTAGLVAYYPFNGSFTDAAFGVGNAQVSFVNGVADRFGVANRAITLVRSGTTSVGGYIISNNNGRLPIGGAARTLVAWFLTRANGSSDAYRNIAGYGTEMTGQRYGLSMRTDFTTRIDYPLFTGESTDVPGTTTFAEGTWHQLGATFDGTTATLYVDGRVEASRGLSLNTVGQALYIGRSPPPYVTYYPSAIDDVRIYDRALSAAEMASLYYENGWR